MSKLKMVKPFTEVETESLFSNVTLDEAIQRLKDLGEAAEESGYCNIVFSARSWGYDGGTTLYVEGLREETDREYKDRVKSEEREKKRQKAFDAKKEENDRKLYEKLKKKFGDKE